ncbi:MAG TPA: hypothetical protein VFE25_13040, partial [Opitutaceae bacterium]|nr:hypothetical protein [Opitutaceae bacterium]
MDTKIPKQGATTLLAFFNDPTRKEHYLARIEQHAKADELRQGFGYWKEDDDGHYRGCAVGCTLHSSNHSAYETELGIPRALAHLEDQIFENLSKKDAMKWPKIFLEAVPVGADLSLVVTEFMLWLLVDKNDGVIRVASAAGKIAIETVAALLRRKLAGDNPSVGEWNKAAAAAAEAEARWAAAAAAARWAAAAA